MKNVLLLFTATILILAGCNTTEPAPQVVLGYFTPYQTCPEYLTGQIESVTETNYWAVEENGTYIKGAVISKAGRDSLNWSADFKARFDENGIMTSLDYFTESGIPRGWVIESTEGLWRSSTWWYNDTAWTKYNLFYNDLSHYKSAERIRVKDNKIINSYNYVTDDKGNIISAEVLDTLGIVTGKFTFKINDKNLVEKYSDFSATDSLVYEMRNSFGEDGFYIKSESYDGSNKLVHTIEMEYTKYDENGNWLTALISRDGKVFGIVERVYTYY